MGFTGFGIFGYLGVFDGHVALSMGSGGLRDSRYRYHDG